MKQVVNSSQYFVSRNGSVLSFETAETVSPFQAFVSSVIKKLMQYYSLSPLLILARGGEQTPESILARVIMVDHVTESFPDKLNNLKFVFGNTPQEGKITLEIAKSRFDQWNEPARKEEFMRERWESNSVKDIFIPGPPVRVLPKADTPIPQEFVDKNYQELEEAVLTTYASDAHFKQALLNVYDKEHRVTYNTLKELGGTQEEVRFKRLYAFLVYSKKNSKQKTSTIAIDLGMNNNSGVSEYIRQHKGGKVPNYQLYLDFAKNIFIKLLIELS